MKKTLVYIFSSKSFLRYNRRIGGRIKLFKISNLESFDIDTQDEFDIIKKILESENSKN